MSAENGLVELAQKLVKNAALKGQNFAFAESCTGGLAAVSVTSVSGASDVFLGSAVTYSNEAKRDILGVKEETLSSFGAVSAECAEEMALGARKIYNSDMTVGITGIAGPDGGSPQKPVGTVWFAFSSEDKQYSFLRLFEGDRSSVRTAAAEAALSVLLKETNLMEAK